MFKKYSFKKISTLYNCIDVSNVHKSHLDRQLARNILNIPNNYWVIGNVARLHKDQSTLIRGFAKALPNLPKNSLLVIIGTGNVETKLKSLPLELNIQKFVFL